MTIAAEVDALHELCELEQRLRPEVQREIVDGAGSPILQAAHDKTCARIVQVCRALLAAVDG